MISEVALRRCQVRSCVAQRIGCALVQILKRVSTKDLPNRIQIVIDLVDQLVIDQSHRGTGGQVVYAREGHAGQVRRRIGFQDISSNHTITCCRNNVTREQRAGVRSVCQLRSRRRIGDRDQLTCAVECLRIVSGDLKGRRHRCNCRVRYHSPVFFEIAKEESPVPSYGTSDRSAKLVQIEGRPLVPNPVLEEIVGVENLVPPELEHRAVKLVGARSDAEVHHRTGSAPILRRKRIRLNAEFLRRIHRRDE